MQNDYNLNSCFNCNKNENIVPLISMTFTNINIWICPQCLPTLIHDSSKLDEQLKKITNNDTE